MAAFLLTTGIITLALGLVSCMSSMRELSLLSDYIEYRVRAAISGFIAIVISIILTLVFHFLR